MIKEYLEDDLQSKKLNNSYLICTDDPKLAMNEVLSFLGENFYGQQDTLTHPDFILLQKSEGNVKNISVAQTRDLQSFLNKTSVISGIKSAIIYNAEQMNLNASNSCLKILEDTPRNTYIFLITSHAAAILPTIRSRVAKIRFNYKTNNAQIKQVVEDYYVTPFLKSTKIDEHLSYLKDFGSKDRDLWINFTSNAQKLFARIIKSLTGDEGTILSELEKRFLEQMMPLTLEQVIQKYNNLTKITEASISFDLDLKSSYLLIVKGV